jgi:hypothetical protein
MPALTGTLRADAFEPEVLAAATVAILPLQTYYIDPTTLGLPVTEVSPADPAEWIRGTRWEAIKGHPTTVITGTPWPDVRHRR